MTTNLLPEALLHNRYRIVRAVGQGGMGAVYEAVDTRLGSTVALKQTLVRGEEWDAAFAREARLLSSLRHAALPVVSDYFAEGEGHFLVMQFMLALCRAAVAAATGRDGDHRDRGAGDARGACPWHSCLSAP